MGKLGSSNPPSRSRNRSGRREYQDYRDKQSLLSKELVQVTPHEFYDDIFPDDDLERPGCLADRRANMIIAYKVDTASGKTLMRNEIVFAGKDGLAHAYANSFALCGLCTYSGKHRTAANAYKCYGFAFDLDGVGAEECTTFLSGVKINKLPRPQYIVNSGHGLHLYYIFESPVPLYPAVRDRLQRLKKALTRVVWTNETSYIKSRPDRDMRDYLGIYQNMRMPGSCSKIGKGKARKNYLVTAYRYTTYPTIRGARCTLEYLNEWVDEQDRVPTTPDYSSWDYATDHLSLEEAKQEWPEWYRKRIVEQLPPGQWVCNKHLYEWWIDRIQQGDGARDGTRYNCISVLFIYAIKCAVPFAEALEDALDLVEPFNERTVKPDNEFTDEDVQAASKYYQRSYARYSIKMIELKTHIQLPRNKRNGRNQADHCKLMRLIRDEINGHKDIWREGNGRKPKQEIVTAWRNKHPNGRKIDCERDTGLSRHTVLKWWGSAGK